MKTGWRIFRHCEASCGWSRAKSSKPTWKRASIRNWTSVKRNGNAPKLNEQKISYLEAKIREQDQLIKTLTQKADAATEQVQSIANRALDTSVQRFAYPLNSEEKQTSGKA